MTVSVGNMWFGLKIQNNGGDYKRKRYTRTRNNNTH